MLTADGTYKRIHIYRNANLRRTKVMGINPYPANVENKVSS
jgi:hypothetical protein